LFEQAIAETPITLPSHATIMTGLNAPEHGVRHNGTFRLAEEHRTLAEILDEAGYATAAFVGAFVLDRRYGLAQGFQRYDDAVRPRDESEIAMGRFNERPADEVTDAVLAWLDENAGRTNSPFMIWAHYFDPHAPYDPPAPFSVEFSGDPYQGEVAFTDAQVERLIRGMERRGLRDETLVVFTADHGEGLGEHDEQTHADLIYDSTLRVPLLFSNPAIFPRPVVVNDRLAGLVDLLPTVLDLLDIPHEGEGLAGRRLFSTGPEKDRALYIETLAPMLDYGWAPLQGLRRLEDKFILAPTPEYYAIAEDPDESRNLYGSIREADALRARLTELLDRWPPVLETLYREQPLSREERERLASLGYARPSQRPAEIGLKDPKEMMALRRRMHEAGEASLRGEHRIAAESIQAVLREDPGSAKAWYTAVRIFERAKDPVRAEASLRRALELRPRPEGWISLARYVLARDDRAEFERALAEAERLDPLNGGIWIGRGHALVMDGRYTEALQSFEKALEVDPVRSGPYARRRIEQLRALLGREGAASQD
jgi:arylsulfatase A-like enzyme